MPTDDDNDFTVSLYDYQIIRDRDGRPILAGDTVKVAQSRYKYGAGERTRWVQMEVMYRNDSDGVLLHYFYIDGKGGFFPQERPWLMKWKQNRMMACVRVRRGAEWYRPETPKYPYASVGFPFAAFGGKAP